MSININNLLPSELIVTGWKRFLSRVWEKAISVVSKNYTDDNLTKIGEITKLWKNNKDNLAALQNVISLSSKIIDEEILANQPFTKSRTVVRINSSEYMKRLSNKVKDVSSQVFCSSIQDNKRLELNQAALKEILKKVKENANGRIKSLTSANASLTEDERNAVIKCKNDTENKIDNIESTHLADIEAHSGYGTGVGGTEKTAQEVQQLKIALNSGLLVSIGKELLGESATDSAAETEGRRVLDLYEISTHKQFEAAEEQAFLSSISSASP